MPSRNAAQRGEGRAAGKSPPQSALATNTTAAEAIKPLNSASQVVAVRNAG